MHGFYALFTNRLGLFLFFSFTSFLFADVKTGADVFFEKHQGLISGKKVALLSHNCAVNAQLKSTLALCKEKGVDLAAVFAPEHGYYGSSYAYQKISDDILPSGIPIYSLHGDSRRPSSKMLKGVDVVIIDLQDVGLRCYTYLSTMLYMMEEAAKYQIEVIVLDRPNPINGYTVDGPLLDKSLRSFIGYLNVPLCHGMTMGELANFFNQEEKLGAKLRVIPMEGWKRSMSFEQTGLKWVPTSPQIPEYSTTHVYPMTNLLGSLSVVSIGIGYTLPFKVIGAPWIDAEKLTAYLRQKNIKGVDFQPFYFRPFFGKFKAQDCEGVLLVVEDPQKTLPVWTQFELMDALRKLYPAQFKEALAHMKGSKRSSFEKACGSTKVLELFEKNPEPLHILKKQMNNDRRSFTAKRKKYLNPAYGA